MRPTKKHFQKSSSSGETEDERAFWVRWPGASRYFPIDERQQYEFQYPGWEPGCNLQSIITRMDYARYDADPPCPTARRHFYSGLAMWFYSKTRWPHWSEMEELLAGAESRTPGTMWEDPPEDWRDYSVKVWAQNPPGTLPGGLARSLASRFEPNQPKKPGEKHPGPTLEPDRVKPAEVPVPWSPVMPNETEDPGFFDEEAPPPALRVGQP